MAISTELEIRTMDGHQFILGRLIPPNIDAAEVIREPLWYGLVVRWVTKTSKEAHSMELAEPVTDDQVCALIAAMRLS